MHSNQSLSTLTDNAVDTVTTKSMANDSSNTITNQPSQAAQSDQTVNVSVTSASSTSTNVTSTPAISNSSLSSNVVSSSTSTHEQKIQTVSNNMKDLDDQKKLEKAAASIQSQIKQMIEEKGLNCTPPQILIALVTKMQEEMSSDEERSTFQKDMARILGLTKPEIVKQKTVQSAQTSSSPSQVVQANSTKAMTVSSSSTTKSTTSSTLECKRQRPTFEETALVYPYPWSKQILPVFARLHIKLFSKEKQPLYREGPMELYEGQLKTSSVDHRATFVRLNKKAVPLDEGFNKRYFHYDLEKIAKLRHENLVNVTHLADKDDEPSFLVEDLPRSEWQPLDEWIKCTLPPTTTTVSNGNTPNPQPSTAPSSSYTVAPSIESTAVSSNSSASRPQNSSSAPSSNSPQFNRSVLDAMISNIIFSLIKALVYLADNNYPVKRLSMKKIFVNKKTGKCKLIFFNFDTLTERPDFVDVNSTNSDPYEIWPIAAPESYISQENKEPQTTSSSNFYSLGCIAAKLMTGLFPYQQLNKTWQRKELFLVLTEKKDAYANSALKDDHRGEFFKPFLEHDSSKRISITTLREYLANYKPIELSKSTSSSTQTTRSTIQNVQQNNRPSIEILKLRSTSSTTSSAQSRSSTRGQSNNTLEQVMTEIAQILTDSTSTMFGGNGQQSSLTSSNTEQQLTSNSPTPNSKSGQ